MNLYPSRVCLPRPYRLARPPRAKLRVRGNGPIPHAVVSATGSDRLGLTSS